MHSPRLALVVVLVTAAASSAGSQTAPLPPLPVTRLDALQPDPELDGRRMSFGFAQPTPVRDLLLMLVRGTRLSLIPSTTIEQTFVGDLKNVTLREALDLILEPIGLDYSVRGQVIRVFPREFETRLFSVDYVSTRSATPDLYDDLAGGVRSLLSTGGSMNLDRTAALLQVTDSPNRLVRIENYLETVMLRATRQVQIEATVIEVELSDRFSTGIDWPAVRGKLNTPIGASALLKALAEQGSVSVLARPRVTAMNNEPAVVRIDAAPQTLASGIVLSVTPQISADGIVHVSVSVPEVETLVRVRHGETIVVAGGLRRSEASSRRIELVILLTPTIMFPGDTAARAAQTR